MLFDRRYFLIALLAATTIPSFALRNETVSFASDSATSLLEVFQVYSPPLNPTERRGSTVCSYTLMEHVFSNSAGNPYVGAYKPLCGSNWDIAVLNLSVVSYGRQFDRLGSIWIGDTELWRTCTAEPVWSGIHFTFSKDVTVFKSLLQSPQTLVVDIGNYVVGPYNGSFNATLSVEFYNVVSPPMSITPDKIIPLSKPVTHHINSYFSLPNDNTSIPISIPDNSSHVSLEVFASGNGQEEFWYTNVPEEYTYTFGAWNISFLGQGSFREILVSIDNVPVGVVWPYEVVFTGGICPGFWRPIVGHRTFDLPSYTIDLTPYIDYLRHGTHRIQFAVNGQPNTLQNWFVSGHLRVWSSNSTNASFPLPDLSEKLSDIRPQANVSTSGKVTADNTSFSVTTVATRIGESFSLNYSNQQTYQLLENGLTVIQNLSQKTYFESPLSRGYYIFNLTVEEVDVEDGIHINATLSQIFHRSITNSLDGSNTVEHAEVQSSGRLLIGKTRNISQGNTSVLVSYNTPRREYVRDVKAIGFQIVSDYEMDKSVGFYDQGQFSLQIPT